MRARRRQAQRPQKRKAPAKKEQSYWCYAGGKILVEELPAESKFRCPMCNRRLKPKNVFNGAGAFVEQKVPRHKAK